MSNNQIFTCVYSSCSVEEARKLVNSFIRTLVSEYSELNFDNMFYAGVFCATTTYANYEYWDELSVNLERPEILTSVCSTEQERINYVDEVINAVIKGEIEKPEWMVEIEGTAVCDENSLMSPSTFLRLIPKDNKYTELGERLISFLYSINLLSTIIEND